MSKKTFEVGAAVEPVEFDVDGETFSAYAPEQLPAYVLIQYSELVQAGKIHEAHRTFFSNALQEESAERFNARLESHESPIPLRTMIEVAEWLVSEYSNFPTKPAKR